MATLCEGQQYGLTSHLNHSIHKSLIFVKLTDSALKAIEDYLNAKGTVCSNSKPSIELRSNHSQGVISIPSAQTSNVEDEHRQRFSFTLSNVDAVEPQGSFECIRQTKNQSIESLGNVDYKLQIHANDDSYQKTKVKMAVVEQESKKNSTKVIKASDPNVGRKVKVKRHLVSSSRPTPHLGIGSGPALAQLSPAAPPLPAPVPAAQAVPAVHPGYAKPTSPPTLKLNGNSINGIIPNHKTSSNSVSNNSTNNKINSNNNLNSNPNPNSGTSSPNIEPKKSLREYIVHLLALRPLKKSELISRLSMEGFNDIDKKELISILSTVSHLKDNNVYSLSKTGWTEVQTDWNNYSSEEKELMKKMNPLIAMQAQPSPARNGLSPLSDCGSMPAFSSPISAMDCSSPSTPRSPALSKRSSESSSVVAKKHKPIVSSHQSYNNAINGKSIKLKTNGYNHLLNGWANKPSSPERESDTSVANLTNGNTNSLTDLKSVDSSLAPANSHSSPDANEICLSQQQFQNQSNRVVTYMSTDSSFAKSHTRDTFSRYKANGYQMSNSSPNSSPDSGTGSHDGSTLSSSNSYLCANDETADYLSKYTKILNNEQRAQYKKDFYIEYEEYRRLHRFVENVATKFTELEIRLNTKIEGSDEWNKLMDQIVKEYEETKSCPKFQKCRKRMFYLHDKLAHIKSLVTDYDRNYHKEKNNRFSHKTQVKSNMS